jgi:uncharacterized membrane protein YhaH (DUF805 family)
MGWYFHVLRNYAVFTGRARRKEYWAFFGLNLLIALALGFIEGIVIAVSEGSPGDVSVLGTLYQLAILIPSIAVGVRRMHDTDHSGWWLLFPVVNFVLAVSDGTRGPNRFGPDPKDATESDAAAAVLAQVSR